LFGHKIIRLDTVDSTNRYAKTLIKKEQEGTIVLAYEQKAGKGRHGRDWYSPPGGLWFSIILRPERPRLFPHVAGIGVCDSLKDLGLKPGIKWPNDILINSRKVAGILIELEGDALIAGIGLDMNIESFPGHLADKVTSLMIETGMVGDREKMLWSILENIEKRYRMLEKNFIDELRLVWRQYSVVLGKEVCVTMPNRTIQGKALDIDEDGSLLIRLDDGSIQRVMAGDCIISV
jgi:BirA family biotin operon repressor/biotin-[acetyl-CoA-carboxylase] ligase